MVKAKQAPSRYASGAFQFEHRSFGRVLVRLMSVDIIGRPDLGRLEIIEGEDKECSFVVPRDAIAKALAA